MRLVGLIVFIGFVEAATVTEFRYREVHMDAELSCQISILNKKWFFHTEPDATVFQPITADNGSHYEISENIAGLRIIDILEADQGYYLVQGDGGISCAFRLHVYGLFSYNSGEKVSNGNYEQTLRGVEGYALTVPCDYNITEVSGAEDTFVDVAAVINNESVLDCEEDAYPYCTGCEACFPLLNNPFKQFLVFPNKGSGTSMLRCRVNLGTPYNGKTVDKQITVNTREVLSVTVIKPYNTSYQLCSNIMGDWNKVISTMVFTGGLPTNQIEYSTNDLPIIVLEEDIEVSCQIINPLGFPMADRVYKYNITLIAITDLPNQREFITESVCEEEMSENLYLDCSYQILGPNQPKEMVLWELNGADCSKEECVLSGEYSEAGMLQLRQLSPHNQSHLVRCSVVISEETYFREWSISLEECPTPTNTPIATVVAVNSTSSTPSTPSTPTQPNVTVTPVTGPIEAGTIVGIIAATLCVIFLLVLFVVAIVFSLYCLLKDRFPKYYSVKPQAKPGVPSRTRRRMNLFNRDPPKVRYTIPEDSPIITV